MVSSALQKSEKKKNDHKKKCPSILKKTHNSTRYKVVFLSLKLHNIMAVMRKVAPVFSNALLYYQLFNYHVFNRLQC